MGDHKMPREVKSPKDPKNRDVARVIPIMSVSHLIGYTVYKLYRNSIFVWVPCENNHLIMFLWFSYGFPMVFLWFSYGFPLVFLWFSMKKTRNVSMACTGSSASSGSILGRECPWCSEPFPVAPPSPEGAQRECATGAQQKQMAWVIKWVCLKIGYIPNYSHLIGIMIINHWV